MQTSEMTFVEAFKKTSSEGVLGFYKGAASPLVGVSLCNAVLFGAYNAAIRAQASQLGIPANVETLPIKNIMFAGAFAGVAAAFVESPVELFKSKMQVQYGTGGQYKGTFDCAFQITKKYGIRGVYQGLHATMIRNLPANALYLGFYEMTKRYMSTPGETPTAAAILSAGSVGGVAYWALCYPTDIIKSRLQTDHSDPSQRKYKGYVDCYKSILKEGGVKSLYRGFTPCMLRSMPANAVGFLCYEWGRSIAKSIF